VEVEMLKKWTPLWCEAHFQLKIIILKKHVHMFRPLLEAATSKKWTPLWHEARSEVKMLKTQQARTTFGRSDVVWRGRRMGLCTLSKESNT
jgi:hypothetical protein